MKMYLVPESEKYMFLRSRGQHYALDVDGASTAGKDILTGDAYLRELSTNPREGTFFASIGVGSAKKRMLQQALVVKFLERGQCVRDRHEQQRCQQ